MSLEEQNKKGSSQQHMLSVIGIIFVLLVGSQSFHSANLQEQLSSYKKEIDATQNMRESMVVITNKYLSAYADILQLDEEVHYKYMNGIMTEEEANATIAASLTQILSILSFMFGNVFIWDDDHVGAFQPSETNPYGLKIYNATKRGAYVVKPEFEWIFTQKAILVGWLPRFYDEIALVDPKFENWDHWELSNYFSYPHSEGIFTDRWAGWVVNISRVDYSLNWWYAELNFEIFDE